MLYCLSLKTQKKKAVVIRKVILYYTADLLALASLPTSFCGNAVLIAIIAKYLGKLAASCCSSCTESVNRSSDPAAVSIFIMNAK